MNLFYRNTKINTKELDWMQELTANDFKLLVNMIALIIDNNKVFITLEIKTNIIKSLKCSKQTFESSLIKLQAKDIIKKVQEGQYNINEHIIIVE